ncbi:hypothetical protein HELRODRAFT_64381, partial [Helobdella robusta]|uniref:ETS domain-containing protein n=1 Tax=Helobdella robusta TaxID=6412 RepID=T1FXU0_HELRO
LSNFMRDLLNNPQYNPSCVRWENKEQGIFRIISGKSKFVAELWGQIKNNSKMTFEKMGRSLRLVANEAWFFNFSDCLG